ncbi:MAG: beta-phosphoglucomutase [Saprospiraceae bacterium]|nr:beta-phosphoglucomutase [Saprospiraceae bacterium]
MIKACIFDLDGVLVDTARYHFQSWKKLTAQLGFTIEDSIEERLKGVSRMDSLNIILDQGGYKATEDEKRILASQKNDWYLESITDMNHEEVLNGVQEFIENLKENGIKMAVGSASKNAKPIIEKVGIGNYFESIVDGNMVIKTKPDPEVFLKAASDLDVEPGEAIVFEDSYKGIEAANTGGFYSVGIGLESNLSNARLVIPNFIGHNFESITAALKS